MASNGLGSLPYEGQIYIIQRYLPRISYHLYNAIREDQSTTWNFREDQIEFAEINPDQILYIYDL